MNNQEQCGCVEKPSLRTKWRKLRRKIWNSLFGDIPNNHESITITKNKDRWFEIPLVASFVEDGFDIGIGSMDRWYILLERSALHKIILWYLWRWAWGEWFGLRRYLFYKFLKRRIERSKKFGKR